MSHVYRSISSESQPALRSLQSDIHDQLEGNFMRRIWLHTTIASSHQMPRQAAWSTTELKMLNQETSTSASDPYEAGTAWLGLLGYHLGATSLCLMLSDEADVLMDENKYFNEVLYRRRSPASYQPHVALGTIAAHYTDSLLDSLEVRLPESISLLPVSASPMIHHLESLKAPQYRSQTYDENEIKKPARQKIPADFIGVLERSRQAN